jgi:hypothetical protein
VAVGLKGIVRRKLRFVINGINRQLFLYCLGTCPFLKFERVKATQISFGESMQRLPQIPCSSGLIFTISSIPVSDFAVTATYHFLAHQ